MATFMAKINENLPAVEDIYIKSLWDKSGKKNLFHDTKDKLKMSALMPSYELPTIAPPSIFVPMFALT